MSGFQLYTFDCSKLDNLDWGQLGDAHSKIEEFHIHAIKSGLSEEEAQQICKQIVNKGINTDNLKLKYVEIIYLFIRYLIEDENSGLGGHIFTITIHGDEEVYFSAELEEHIEDVFIKEEYLHYKNSDCPIENPQVKKGFLARLFSSDNDTGAIPIAIIRNEELSSMLKRLQKMRGGENPKDYPHLIDAVNKARDTANSVAILFDY